MTTQPSYFSGKDLKDLGLELPEAMVTEEDLIALIAHRVMLMMQDSMEELLQVLYRLDIPEAGLAAAMTTADIPTTIARLILERQRLKAESRKKYQGAKPDKDNDLAW